MKEEVSRAGDELTAAKLVDIFAVNQLGGIANDGILLVCEHSALDDLQQRRGGARVVR